MSTTTTTLEERMRSVIAEVIKARAAEIMEEETARIIERLHRDVHEKVAGITLHLMKQMSMTARGDELTIVVSSRLPGGTGK